MRVLSEGTVRTITNFFYWHPAVQDYYTKVVDADDSHLTRSTIENWKIGLKYISEHGNSVWAKIDYFAGKIRVWLFIIAVLIMFALIAGWRP
jgi:hypothetical protein